jgi:hypothetical protein
MKTNILKAAYFLLGLLLVNVNAMHASVGEKFDKFVGSEFSSYQGIYIIVGVVIASLVLYLVVNHFNKEEDEHTTVRHGTHYSHHRRHHHHVHKIIKKTS